MKKILLFLSLVILIFQINSVIAQDSGSPCWSTTNILSYQTKTYEVNGVDYEVEAGSLGPELANFIINGEQLPQLSSGDTYDLSDGMIFGINSLTHHEGSKFIAQFCIDNQSGNLVQLCTSNRAISFVDILTINVDGKDYELSSLVAGTHDYVAQLTVNGERVSVKSGQSQKLSDGNLLSVVDITDNKKGTAYICINGVRGTEVTDLCSSTNSIGQGVTKTFLHDGKQHTIEALTISENGFLVNIAGRPINGIVGKQYVLQDDSIFVMNSISGNKGHFCIGGKAPDFYDKCTTSNVLSRGESESYIVDGEVYNVKIGGILPNRVEITIQEETFEVPMDGARVLKDEDGSLNYDKEFKLSYIDNNEVYFCIGGKGGEIYQGEPTEKDVEELPEDITTQLETDKADELVDLCSSDNDCDDNNACTSDICSGTPKICSNNEISQGCNYDQNCIPMGTRMESKYCDIDKGIKEQKYEDSTCNNNYECSTNICVDSQCISPGFIQKILNWFKNIFG
jgi:hypothetical protein